MADDFTEFHDELRTVAGDLDAVRLLGPVVSQARGNEVFLARLARVAVSHRPPLGFLGRVTVERSGEHVGRFDVKKGAMLDQFRLLITHQNL